MAVVWIRLVSLINTITLKTAEAIESLCDDDDVELHVLGCRLAY